MKLLSKSIYAVFCILLFACNEYGDWPTEKFDSFRWKQVTEAGRFIFAKDLINRQVLIGKSRSEVIELLGTPSSEGDSSASMYYIIKIGGGYSFNHIYLIDVELKGVHGDVTKVGIRGD